MIKYAVREMSIKGEREVIIIEYSDLDKDVWVPSRLTDYIYRQYMNKALNTKLKAARGVVGFMNYLTEEVDKGEDPAFEDLKLQGLFGLRFTHLAKYINYISSSKVKNSYDTVKFKERVLVQFYDFINKAGITPAEARPKKKVVQVTHRSQIGAYKLRKGVLVNISPFSDKQRYVIKYPSKSRKIKVRQDLDYEVWTQLIEYAEQYYPQIAFGVALQCMGGLRQGEVVNLIMDDVQEQKEENILMINIQDRPELFMGRDINLKKSQTKKQETSEQPVFNFNHRLFEIYYNHLKYISGQANETAKKLKALFIDSKGDSMSGDTYEYNFRQLKRDYIEEVRNSSESLARDLSMDKWGSHIGRHVFTNYLIKTGSVNDITGQPDSIRLQLLRRDKNPQSTVTYIDKKGIVQAVNENLNKLSEMAKK